MKYQNTITGAIIDIKSVITSGPWQALKPATPPVTEESDAPVKRKVGKKKDE